MGKIPTAAELFNSKFKTDGGLIHHEDIQEYAVEFAKLHVEAAIKAKIDAMTEKPPFDFSVNELDSFTQDAYPLENIK